MNKLLLISLVAIFSTTLYAADWRTYDREDAEESEALEEYQENAMQKRELHLHRQLLETQKESIKMQQRYQEEERQRRVQRCLSQNLVDGTFLVCD